MHSPQLGLILRRCRLQTGYSGEIAAAKIGWSAAKISRVETGIAPLTVDDFTQLLLIYKVPDADRQQLTEIAGQIASQAVHHGHVSSLDLEAGSDLSLACLIRVWAASAVPPILWTKDYGRAVLASLRTVLRTMPGEERLTADYWLRQQARITGGGAQLRAVLAEAALRRPVGGPDVLREQVEHLLHLSGLAAVRLQILPMDGAGPVLPADFVCLEFPDVAGLALHATVYSSRLTGQPLRLPEEADTYPHRIAMEQLEAAALSPDESAKLIGEYLPGPPPVLTAAGMAALTPESELSRP